MNITKQISLALVALTAASLSSAQTSTATNASTGLLGQRYAEAGFSVTDPRGNAKNVDNVDFGVNLPIVPSLDLSFDYNYGWTKVLGTHAHANSLGVAATGYTTLAGVKAFAGAGVGRTWVHSLGRSNYNTWALSVGAEIPVGDITVTPSISYSDLLNNQSGGQYSYGVEGSMWLTKTLGGFIDVSFNDAVGRGGESWTYAIGVRTKF